MMHHWYMPDDHNNDGLINGAFNKMYSRGNNRWVLMNYACCLIQMIDTTRLLEDADDETDMVVFENRNGGYFLDTRYKLDEEVPWHCLSYDYPNFIARESVSIDRNGFIIIAMSYLDDFSFALMTQDGKGVEYLSFADDASTGGRPKGGGILCDNGSAYDGLYFSRPYDPAKDWIVDPSVFYCPSDSFRGVITDGKTAVETASPSLFRVEVAVPNPFNLSTTIRFTIPSRERVTVDIYNTGGQKAASLMNATLAAGTHAVTWDAADFPSGVYFYTVNAGNFSKTRKMTLVK